MGQRPTNDTPPSLTRPQALDLARELRDAETSGAPMIAFSTRHPEISPADAYAVQTEYTRIRLAEGARLVGRKVGCTSEAVQQQFGVDTPDYGSIFTDMVVEDGGSIEHAVPDSAPGRARARVHAQAGSRGRAAGVAR